MDDTEICSASFPEYKELDDILKCGICYETITTPVITSCAHTFCSICIRKWLITKQVCPSCSESVYESSLRRNPIVANIVETIKLLKRKKSGRKKPVNSPSCSYSVDNNDVKSKYNNPSCSGQDDTFASPRNSTIKDRNDCKPKISTIKTPSPIVNGDEHDFKSNPSVKKTPPATLKDNSCATKQVTSQKTPTVQRSPAPLRVPCPLCQVEMPERLVFDHLDRCSGVAPSRSSDSKNHSGTKAQMSSPSISGTVKKSNPKSSVTAENNNVPLEPIKKMVYNLMSDKQLKTELKKYGLPAQGDRRTLLSRLQRFVIMHNAECDSNNPRPLVVIRQQLEKEEKAMSSSSATTSFSQMFKKTNDPNEIEENNKQYLKQNNASYQNLIEQIKKRTQSKPKIIQAITVSDEEDDPPVIVPKTTPHVSASCKNGQGDSDSDNVPGDVAQTPHNPRNMAKHVKRKVQCIESESENEAESERPVQLDKKAKEATSPVLTVKTPVRRKLRSNVSQSENLPQLQEPPKPRTRKQRKCKTGSDEQEQPAKQTQRGIGNAKDVSKSVCSDNLPEKDVVNKLEEERLLSPTPDLFCSPPSPASSEIPCGQKTTKEESENEYLKDLVSMMDESSGSSTDFES